MEKVILDSIEWKIYEHPKIVVPSTFRWTEADPLTIQVGFHIGLEEPVRWLIGRDLLHDAITHNTAGYADVQVVTVDDTMLMTLDSPAGSQRFVTDASTVGMFIARTYSVTPRHTEADAYDMSDKAMAQRLAEWA